jgi:hypothetical protein
MTADQQPITDAERRILDIARNEWSTERSIASKDSSERRLLAAIVLAYPGDIHTRQNCTCDEPLTCDECMDESAIPGLLSKARKELGIPEPEAGQ